MRARSMTTKALLASSLVILQACSAFEESGLDRPGESSLEDQIGNTSATGSSFGRADIWKTENATCDIKGNASNWQAAYCMWLHQAGEFDDSAVQECFSMLNSRPAIPQKICERNLYFKREICKSLAVDGYFHRSVDECVASDYSVPKVVREGLQ